MLEDLLWLQEKSSQHASVDTFAKKLFLKNSNDILRLKMSLSIFFRLIQLDKAVDLRYDTFFASILNSLYNIPNNIKIISWNYDYQFEKAYCGYSDDNRIIAANAMLKISNKNSNSLIKDPFIYKLNGTAQIIDKKNYLESYFVSEVSQGLNRETFSEVAANYASMNYFKDNFRTGLSFAWEKEEGSFINDVITAIRNTTVLVVIGYSFPYFNREIDRKIIKSLNLRKVYFQSPEADIIKERFKAIIEGYNSNMELVTFNDCKEFMLPNEL